jgi:thioredoxin
MPTVQVTQKNFADLTGKGIVLIDWWAVWCGPCRTFAPIFESAAERHEDVVFGKIDTDEEQELAGRFGIRSIPTLMAFRDGVLLFSQAGVVPPALLDVLIQKVKELDMDEIRRKIDEEQPEASR